MMNLCCFMTAFFSTIAVHGFIHDMPIKLMISVVPLDALMINLCCTRSGSSNASSVETEESIEAKNHCYPSCDAKIKP